MIATIVTPDGASFIGENDCLDAQEICPREGMATGEGYHLCKEVCQQVGHAEIVALAKAGDRARGSSIYLQGHTYICDACKEACRAAGISEMFVCAPAGPARQTNLRSPNVPVAPQDANTPHEPNLVGDKEVISSLRKAVERFTDFELEIVAALDGNRLQSTIRNAMTKAQEVLRSTEVAE
ncbi:hypothetical protein [Neorhizobium sp. NCHU2750]|uniref:hypothetical protein n=1 Tax=Neorhizobium sp. NCHU2750 TaxID=1825976 RepID=UPI0013C52A71